MSAAAIARYLKDFDAPAERRPAVRENVAEAIAQAVAEPEPFDLEVERTAAFEAGRQAALAEAETLREAALRGQDEHHRQAISELSERYEGEITRTFAKRFEFLTARLGEEIGKQVAELLGPFVEEALLERMVAEFAKTLSEAIAEGSVVSVSGPRQLLDRLSSAPALSGVDLKQTVTDDVDLSVEIGSTLIATRLGAWSSALREVLS